MMQPITEKQPASPVILTTEQTDSAPFFTSKKWFECFAQHITSDSSVLWLATTQTEQGKTLPLLSRPDKNGILHPYTLFSMSNYYSPVYGMMNCEITDTLNRVQLSHTAIHKLKQHDCINISPLYQPQADIWLKTFSDIGFTGQSYQHSMNWYHDNIRDINQYWSLRPPRLINTIKRKRDLMQKAGEFSTTIYSSGNRSQLIQALIDYHHVYYHSWKQKEPYPAFIDAIAEYAWQLGELRIGIIYHQQQPVAAQIWFVSQASAYIFKLAHVESHAKFSPGTVLMATMLEHVISQDNVNRIDFLTGNDSYKQDWMSDKRPLYGIYLCNRHTYKGLCLSVLNMVGRFGKKLPFIR